MPLSSTSQRPAEQDAELPSQGAPGEAFSPESATFHSILFGAAQRGLEDNLKEETVGPPDFCRDLNLDQIIDAVTAGKGEYNLKPFFYAPLKNVDTVLYRQEIFQDLEKGSLLEHITSFAQKMRAVREHLAKANELYYKLQKERWFLDSAEIYCEAIDCLVRDLSLADLKSDGLSAFRKCLTTYARSDRFTLLSAETKRLKADLAEVKYCVFIEGSTVKVSKLESEADYSVQVEETFGKFNQEMGKDYRVRFHDLPNMNHIEAKILDFVAQLYPRIFLHLESFCRKNDHYMDDAIAVFDREIQFYVAYLEFLAPFRQAELKFCYPGISDESKDVLSREGFDIALAQKLTPQGSSIVCNDFSLEGEERVLVVSGPNQSGKTTFARTFGQLHYLASLGCPVPGSEAQLLLFDSLFTHFERQEDIKDLRGKLEDDLVRIYSILNRATPSSIIILNEIFTSTTLKDAVFLSEKVMQKIADLDLLCVWGTFIDELASFSGQTVSMVGNVAPENPTVRTYKITRRPADGLSYALTIAEKHRLTYLQLKKRVRS